MDTPPVVPEASPQGTIRALMAVATPENPAMHEAFTTFVMSDLAEPALWRAMVDRFNHIYPELARRRA
jgi:hypothetical protein